MKLMVVKNNFRILLVPNYRDLRYELFARGIYILVSRLN